MKHATDRKGFSLVEVTLAMGIAAVCLLSVVSLLPAGLTTNYSSVQTTIAASILNAVATDLRNVSSANSSSSQFGLSLSATSDLLLDEAGQKKPGDARFRVKVTPVGSPNNGAAWLRVVISWPAAAESNPQGSLESFVVVNVQ